MADEIRNKKPNENKLSEKQMVVKAGKKNGDLSEKKSAGRSDNDDKKTTAADNPLGLEELPDEIQKRLEKKKVEIEQQRSKTKLRKKKKKVARKITIGKAYIRATYNNTIVSLTDLQGNVLAWASAGMAGFKGPKKSTPYAASIITRLAVGKAREEYGLAEVSVLVNGIGTGRESAVRALNNNGLIINSIQDVTPIPHNGCRPKKPRRV